MLETLKDSSDILANVPPKEAPRSWVCINGSALQQNAIVAKQNSGSASLCAIVKADAYGHGVEIVAPILAEFVTSFGVASLAEALELNALKLNKTIHILGALLPTEQVHAIQNGFEITVSNKAEIEQLTQLTSPHSCLENKPAKVWLEVDTGMGRSGCAKSQVTELVRYIESIKTVELLGLSSHCPSADEEVEFTFAELLEWENLVEFASKTVGRKLSSQIANSAVLLGYRRPQDQRTRPGILLYGISPLPEHQAKLAPVLSWYSQVCLVRQINAGSTVSYGRTWTAEKPTFVATVTAGYADGYSRHYANGDVLIRGTRCPILGRITMDQFMVDVSCFFAQGQPISAGEPVCLLGQDGEEQITATQLAKRANTIPWEVFTLISKRVIRTRTDNAVK